MPRRPRTEIEGGIHHVTMRGNRKQAMFHDDHDRRFFLAQLDVTSRQYGWSPLSHCLMSNHCHLVIETPGRTLGLGMRRLGSLYAYAFNSRHGVDGHLFQGRYWSSPIDSDEYFAQVLRYVALNPVAAGLCTDPEQWQWSSHRQLLSGGGKGARVDELLEAWGGPEGGRYARLFDPESELAAKFGDASPWTHRPPLEQLLATVPRDDGLHAARRHRYRLAEIAAALGVHESTVSRRLSRSGQR
jgi:putative transposase